MISICFQINDDDIILTADTDLFPTDPEFLQPLGLSQQLKLSKSFSFTITRNFKFSIFPFFSIVNLENEFKVWIFWWEAVIELNQSFPLGLLAMKAKTWASLMQHSKTVDELVHLPGSQRRVFTESNETTGTWEIDQSITTSAILK